MVMKVAELLNDKTAVKTLTVNVFAEDMYVPEQCTATVGCVHADATLVIQQGSHMLMMVAHASATVDFANNALIDFTLLREMNDYIYMSKIEGFSPVPYNLYEVNNRFGDNETLTAWIKTAQRDLSKMSFEDFKSLPLTIHGTYSEE